jgi:hypothetical protein
MFFANGVKNGVEKQEDNKLKMEVENDKYGKYYRADLVKLLARIISLVLFCALRYSFNGLSP